MNLDKVLGHLVTADSLQDDNVRGLLFGNYFNPDNRVYDEITDLQELTKVMET